MQTTTRRSANDLLVRSFMLSLEAANHSPNTRKVYGWAIRRLLAFTAEQGMPDDLTALTREHLEAFIVAVLKQSKPATAAAAYRGLRQLYNWLLEEGEIAVWQ